MAGIIDSLKAGDNINGKGCVQMDSHERIEYFQRRQVGSSRFDRPCRWVIEACGDGYDVSQYDTRLFHEEVAGVTCWNNPSIIEANERELFSMRMRVVQYEVTSKGAYNVWLLGDDNPGMIVNLLIVKDYIEKIQFINHHDDSQTIYKSAVDKICFMEIEDKRAIYQTAYQMMASASPTRKVGPNDDPSIDELIRSTCYLAVFGNVIWNQIDMVGPWDAFRTVSMMDQSAKAAILSVLLNVARVDNTRVRIDILFQLCSASQCNIPFPYQVERMPDMLG